MALPVLFTEDKNQFNSGIVLSAAHSAGNSQRQMNRSWDLAISCLKESFAKNTQGEKDQTNPQSLRTPALSRCYAFSPLKGLGIINAMGLSRAVWLIKIPVKWLLIILFISCHLTKTTTKKGNSLHDSPDRLNILQSHLQFCLNSFFLSQPTLNQNLFTTSTEIERETFFPILCSFGIFNFPPSALHHIGKYSMASQPKEWAAVPAGSHSVLPLEHHPRISKDFFFGRI